MIVGCSSKIFAKLGSYQTTCFQPTLICCASTSFTALILPCCELQGTNISAGKCRGIVYGTGTNTEIGEWSRPLSSYQLRAASSTGRVAVFNYN